MREYAEILHEAAGGAAGAAPRIAPAGAAFGIVHAAGGGAAVHFDRLYAKDESHPSFEGSYLIACVFFAVLTGRSPVGLAAPTADTVGGAAVLACAMAWEHWVRAPGALSAAEAAYLQRVAHDAVLGAAPKL